MLRSACNISESSNIVGLYPAITADALTGYIGLGTSNTTHKLTIEASNPSIAISLQGDSNILYQQLNIDHDHIIQSYDSYWDGSNWISSSSNTNYQISKSDTSFIIYSGCNNTKGSSIDNWYPALSINSNGFVGLGVSNPYYHLDVAGDVLIRSNVIINGTLTVDNFEFAMSNMTVGSNFTVYNKTTLCNEVDVYGLCIFNSNVIFSQGINIGGSATVTNNITVSSNATICNELHIGGSTVLYSNLTLSNYGQITIYTSNSMLGVNTSNPLNMITLMGLSNSMYYGPNLSYYLETDINNPIYQQFHKDPDNISTSYGAYWDGYNWISSTSNGNFQMVTRNGKLIFQSSGFGYVGSNINNAWKTSLTINSNSYVGIQNSNPTMPLDVTGQSIFRSNINVTGDIIPNSNITYNLGNSNNRFKDLWLSGNSLNMDGLKLSRDSYTGGLTVYDENVSGLTRVWAKQILIGDPSDLLNSNVYLLQPSSNGMHFENVTSNLPPQPFSQLNDLFILTKNVGIGNSNPVKTLVVDGDVEFNPNYYTSLFWTNNILRLESTYIDSPNNALLTSWSGLISTNPTYFKKGGYYNGEFVRCSYNSNYLTTSSNFAVNSTDNLGFTSLALLRFNKDPRSNETIYSFSNNNFLLQFGRSNISDKLIFTTQDMIGHELVSQSGTIYQNEWALYGIRYDGTSNIVNMYKNGSNIATVNLALMNNMNFDPTTNISIGNGNIDISTMYMFDRWLYDNELNELTSNIMNPGHQSFKIRTDAQQYPPQEFYNEYSAFLIVGTQDGCQVYEKILTNSYYGNGKYKQWASSEFNLGEDMFSFDPTNGWRTIYPYYNNTNDSAPAPCLFKELPTIIRAAYYQIKADVNMPNATPSKWNLYTSMDNLSWQLIDKRDNELNWVGGEQRLYTTNTTTIGKFFKLEVFKNDSYPNYFIKVADWLFYGDEEQFVIDGSGIGINTGLPSEKLTVVGNAIISDNLYVGEIKDDLKANLYIYPPIALTNSNVSLTSYSYGNGIYTISQSAGNGIFAFDNNPSTAWVGQNNAYNSGGIYTGSFNTVVDGNGILGDWIQIQLPESIILKSYSITPTSTGSAPFIFNLVGSYDGITWTSLDYQTYTWSAYFANVFYISNNICAFNYIRLISQKVGNTLTNIGAISINSFILYGDTFNSTLSNKSKLIVQGDILVKDHIRINKLNIDKYWNLGKINSLPDGALVSQWGLLSQAPPLQPVYYNNGGYKNMSYVRFNNNSLFAGIGTFKPYTNNGFTLLLLVKFNGITNSSEQIVTFDGQIAINSSSGNLNFIVGANILTTNTLPIIQEDWAIYGFRYNNTTTKMEIFKNNILLTSSYGGTNLTYDISYQYGTLGSYNISADISTLYIWDSYINDDLLVYETDVLLNGNPELYVDGNIHISNVNKSLNIYNNTLLTYPPISLISNQYSVKNELYGNGLYNIKTSGCYQNLDNYDAYNVFNNINYWQGPANSYNATGQYIGNSEVYGDWIQIELPETIILNSYFIDNTGIVSDIIGQVEEVGANGSTSLVNYLYMYNSWTATINALTTCSRFRIANYLGVPGNFSPYLTITSIENPRSGNVEQSQINFTPACIMQPYTSTLFEISSAPINTANSWHVYGSLNGHDWFILDTQTFYVWSSENLTQFSINNTVPYKFYRLVITNINTNDFQAIIKHFSLLGQSLNISSVKDDKMIIYGNLGIGTTNPLSALTVAGDILPSSNLIYNLGNSNNRFKELYLSGNSIDMSNLILSKDSNVDGLIITNSNNGMSRITVKEILLGDPTNLSYSNQLLLIATSNGLQVQNNGNSNYTQMNNAYFTNTSLGIGTSNPNALLDISGSSNAIIIENSLSSNAIYMTFIDGQNNNAVIGYDGYGMYDSNNAGIFTIATECNNPIRFLTSNIERLRINSNMTINTDIIAQCNLSINGTLTVNNFVYMESNVLIYNSEIIQSNLTVDNNATFCNNVNIYGIQSNFANVNYTSNVLINSNLTIYGNTTTCNVFTDGFTSNTGNMSISSNLIINGFSTTYGISTLCNTNIYGTQSNYANVSYASNVLLNSGLTTYGTTSLCNTNIYGTQSNFANTSFSSNVFINSNLTTNGITTLCNNLITYGNVSFCNNLNINNNLIVNSNLTINSNLSVAGNFTINGVSLSNYVNLISSNASAQTGCNNSTFGSNVSIFGTLTVGQFTTLCNASYLNSNLTVLGPTTLSNTLSNFGTASFLSNVIIKSNLDVYGAINFWSNVSINGTINANTIVSQCNITQVITTLTLSNTYAFSNGLISYGSNIFWSNLYINGTTTINSNTTLCNSLDTYGPAKFWNTLYGNSNLTIIGSTTLCNNLSTYGNANFYSNVILNNTLVVSSNATFCNSANFYGTVNLWNGVNLSNTITSYGSLNLLSNLTTCNIVTNGIATFNSNVNINQNLNIIGNLGIQSNLFTSNNLIVNGNATMCNNLFVTGTSTLNTINTSNLNIYGNIIASSNITVSGLSTFSNILINGITSMCNVLNQNSNVNIYGGVLLSNITNLYGLTTFSNTTNFAGITSFSNNVSFSSNITSSGSFTLTNINATNAVFSNLQITGTSTFSNNLLSLCNITTTGLLSYNNVSFCNNLTIASNLIVLGNIINSNACTFNDVTITDRATLCNYLDVFGTATFNSNTVMNQLIVNSNMTLCNTTDVYGNINMWSNVLMNKNLLVNSNTTLCNLVVTNNGSANKWTINTSFISLSNTTFCNTLNANNIAANTLTLRSNLNVYGTTLLSNNMGVYGNAYYNSNLFVNGVLTANTLITFSNDVHVTVISVVGSNSTFCNDVDIYGVTTLHSNLITLQPTSFCNSINSYADTNLYGLVNIYDYLTVNSNATFCNDVLINGNTFISGNITLCNTLIVSSNATFSNDINLIGNLYTSSNAVIGSSLIVNSNTTLCNNLIVDGTATFYSNATFNKQITLNSNIILNGVTNSYNTATFWSNVNLMNVNISGPTSFCNSVQMYGPLYTYSNVIINGPLYTNSNVTFCNNFSSYGVSTFTSNVYINGQSTFSNTVIINSNLNINGQLVLSSNNTLNLYNTVFNCNATFCNGFSSYNTINMYSNLITNARIIATSNVTFCNILNTIGYSIMNGISNTTYLGTGITTLSNTVNIYGIVNINSNININNNLISSNATISNTLFVLGNSYLLSNVNINNNLVASNVTISNNLLIYGTLSNYGNASFASNVIIGSNLSVGNLSVSNNAVFNSNITANSLFVNLATTLSNYTTIYGSQSNFGNVSISSNVTIAGTTSNMQNMYIRSNLTLNTVTLYCSNNNIGIGNANPTSALDINGDLNFSGVLRQGGVPYIGSQWSNNSSNVFLLGSNVGLRTSNPLFALDVNGDINFGGVLRQGGVPYVGSQWSNNSSNVFLFGSNVGIGLSNAIAPLSVNGSASISGLIASTGIQIFKDNGAFFSSNSAIFSTSNTLSITGFSNTTNGILLSIPGGTSNNYFQFTACNNPIMTLTGNGSLGIGISNPVAPLHVNGSSMFSGQAIMLSNQTNPFSLIQNTIGTALMGIASTATVFSTDSSPGDYIIKSFTGNKIILQTGNAGNALCINTNNYVGIGNANASYPLDVIGSARFQGLAGTGNRSLYVDPNGILTINPSDSNLKMNINPIEYGLNDILKLNPISYNWKSNVQPIFGSQKEIGLIAQEVLSIVPEIVHMNKNGYYSLDYEKIVPILIKAIQELNNKVNKLLNI
jgi:UDP-3-O-[3-hydroxymyristoyl] glucosamine N-acyltransferase